jgi:hypothetical protein
LLVGAGEPREFSGGTGRCCWGEGEAVLALWGGLGAVSRYDCLKKKGDIFILLFLLFIFLFAK